MLSWKAPSPSLSGLNLRKNGLRVCEEEHWGFIISVRFYCFESKYDKMLGFLITVRSPDEACRGMGNSPDPRTSVKGKEQGKRHAVPTYNFSLSPITSKDGCISETRWLAPGKVGDWSSAGSL